MEKTNYIELEGGTIIPYSITEGPKFTIVPSGIYELGTKSISAMESTASLTPIKQKDNLINFKGSIIDEIVGRADWFFEPENVQGYKDLKISHKMGILLHGSPGTGKSCAAMLVMQSLQEKHNAVCIDATKMDFSIISFVLDILRRDQSTPIVLFIDEFDSRMSREENRWLSLLDGNNSVNDMIFLGCTNKLSSVPSRIRDRKSRIKHVFQIEQLPHAVYKEYIKDRLLGITDAKAHKFAYLAGESKLTIDQLKNALIDFKLDRKSMISSIKEAATLSTDIIIPEVPDELLDDDDDDCEN